MSDLFLDKSYKAFDFKWFAKNQITILRLLNRKPTKHIARKLFGVSDVFEIDVFILSINPQEIRGYLFDNRTQYKSYLNWRFSAYIYQNMKPIWRFIHFFDTQIANRFFPKLNLGFDELEDIGAPITTLRRAGVGSPVISNEVNHYTYTELRNTFESTTSQSGTSGEEWDVDLIFHNKNVLNNGVLSQFTHMSRILMAFNAYNTNIVDIENAYIELTLKNYWILGLPNVFYPLSFVISCDPDQSTQRPLYSIPALTYADSFASKHFNSTSLNKTASVLSWNEYYNLGNEARDFGGTLYFNHRFYLNADGIQFLKDYSFPVFGISTNLDRGTPLPDMDFDDEWYLNKIRIKFDNVAISVIYIGGAEDYMQIVMLM